MTDAEFNDFIKRIEENEMIEAPKHMKENILNESRKFDFSKQVRGVSKRVEIFLYGLKVAAAVSIAIFGLFTINMEIEHNYYEEKVIENHQKPEDEAYENQITSFLNEKSSNIGAVLENVSSKINAKNISFKKERKK